jgi:hydrogenase large subunit
MQIIAAIDPVTRVEGHLKVEITVDKVNGVQQVVDAKASGTLFRGFEKILVNRDPWDAQHITERICGVCPVAHGMTAVLALDNAAKVTPPPNGRIMRNLVNGANFVDSHILHFYHLAVLDYIDGPAMMPWRPSWNIDKRIDPTTTQTLINHYVAALDMKRKAQEMGAVFGGRLPHPPAYLPGGFTEVPTAQHIAKFRSYLDELIPFINNVYLPDVEALSNIYSDYVAIGRGPGNLLAYGVFELDATGSNKLFRMGRVANGSTTVQPVVPSSITEQVTYSWYAAASDNLNPAAGVTDPIYPKGKAYSWLKAPRYAGAPYEVGPLARMWVNGDYRRGISVMDRHRARALETLKIANALRTWVDELRIGQPVFTQNSVPASATGVGLSEAPRGALGHWLQIANSKIARYQIITPTCWNCSPRDGAGKQGPLEQALVGVPVKDANQPIEVLRVIHSFDPCLDCAVHVMRPAEDVKIFALGHTHGVHVRFPAHPRSAAR